MAKGRDKHQQRQQDLSLFGKDLVRRAGSQCEMCSASGVALQIFEIPPVANEPEFERCAMFCETCAEQISQPKRRDVNHWRCLSGAIWSEVAIVKALAMVMLERISDKAPWASDLQEQAYLLEEEQLLVEQISAELR